MQTVLYDCHLCSLTIRITVAVLVDLLDGTLRKHQVVLPIDCYSHLYIFILNYYKVLAGLKGAIF